MSTTTKRFMVVGSTAVLLANAGRAAGRVTGVEIVVGPTDKLSIAQCPTGKKVLNGGFENVTYSKSGGGEPYDGLLANAPAKSGTAWAAKMLTGTVRARAVCVPEAQAPVYVAGPISEPKSNSIANCPPGTVAIVGGWISNSWFSNGYGESQDDTVTSAPTTNGTGWAVRQFAGKTQASVLCS